MTDNEFRDWWVDFGTKFLWAAELVERGGNRTATLAGWRELLRDVSYEDAMIVNLRMFSGKMPEPESTNRSSTPRHVRSLCRELHPVEPEWKKHTVQNNPKKGIIESDASMAAAYKEAMRILDDGGTKDDVRAMLDEPYGKPVGKQVTSAANYDSSFDEFNSADEF